MDIISGILLGAVQGATEFVPISSTGHLILARSVFGLNFSYELSFDAVLHLSTSLAVLFYFRKEFLRFIKVLVNSISGTGVERKDSTLLIALIVGTIPAAVIGLVFERYIGTVLRSPQVVAWALVGGSILFLLAEKYASQSSQITPRKGMRIGVFQALSLIPGVSRSGASISGGLLLGLTREEATRFAFLLSFPIIFAVGIKKLIDLGLSGLLADVGISLIAGFVSAFVVGVLAIHAMILYLKNHTLTIFVVYRLLLALAVFAALYMI